MKNMNNSAKPALRIIDSDRHVRETDNEITEYMSAGYRARRDAMLYFPLVPALPPCAERRTFALPGRI